MENLALIFMMALLVKHFICDYPLQKWAYQFMNKGKYGHPGGILHASIHGAGTWLVFWQIGIFTATVTALLDAVIHYHVDWAKMNLNAKRGWKPDNSNFWILLGADQLAHHLTYIALVWWVLA